MLLGEGLLTAEGDFHLRQRRLVQPAFHRERFPTSFIAALDACAIISGTRLYDAHREEVFAIGDAVFDAPYNFKPYAMKAITAAGFCGIVLATGRRRPVLT